MCAPETEQKPPRARFFCRPSAARLGPSPSTPRARRTARQSAPPRAPIPPPVRQPTPPRAPASQHDPRNEEEASGRRPRGAKTTARPGAERRRAVRCRRLSSRAPRPGNRNLSASAS